MRKFSDCFRQVKPRRVLENRISAIVDKRCNASLWSGLRMTLEQFFKNRIGWRGIVHIGIQFRVLGHYFL